MTSREQNRSYDKNIRNSCKFTSISDMTKDQSMPLGRNNRIPPADKPKEKNSTEISHVTSSTREARFFARYLLLARRLTSYIVENGYVDHQCRREKYRGCKDVYSIHVPPWSFKRSKRYKVYTRKSCVICKRLLRVTPREWEKLLLPIGSNRNK